MLHETARAALNYLTGGPALEEMPPRITWLVGEKRLEPPKCEVRSNDDGTFSVECDTGVTLHGLSKDEVLQFLTAMRGSVTPR